VVASSRKLGRACARRCVQSRVRTATEHAAGCRFAAEGAQPAGGTPAELAAYVKRDNEKWSAVIRTVDIQAQ
jgi:hypothetical protein